MALILASVAAADIYLAGALERLVGKRIRDDLLVRLTLVQRALSSTSISPEDQGAWKAFADEFGRLAAARVTVVREDGVVLGDSEVARENLAGLENHKNRPEIRDALEKGLGESIRLSDTVKRRMLYMAVCFRNKRDTVGIARLSLPLVEIDRATGQAKRFLAVALAVAFVVAIILSVTASLLASRTARRLAAVARQMANGNLAVKSRTTGHDEFSELGGALDRLAENLSKTLADLKSERDLLAGVLKGMREGVMLLDGETRLTLVNPALREIFLLGSDIIGRPILEVIRHAELKVLLDRATGSGASVSGEIEVIGIRPRRLLVNVSPGVTNGKTLAVLVDVTEIRRLENMRRDLAANASHELRTPVTLVRSAVETLRDAMKKDPEAVPGFLDIIERNVERLHRLVDDLLELSRIESREIRLLREPLSTAEVAKQTLGLFSKQAGKKNIVLSLSAPADLPAAFADRRAVEQVLANLIDNAIKYCPENADVSVGIADEAKFIRVSVQDTGPGIEEKHLSAPV